MENNGRIVCHNVSSYLSLAAKLAGKLSKLMQPTLLNFTQPFEGIRFLSGLQPAGDCKIIQEGVEREGPNLGSLIKQVCDGIILALSDTKICIGMFFESFILQKSLVHCVWSNLCLVKYEKEENTFFRNCCIG